MNERRSGCPIGRRFHVSDVEAGRSGEGVWRARWPVPGDLSWWRRIGRGLNGFRRNPEAHPRRWCQRRAAAGAMACAATAAIAATGVRRICPRLGSLHPNFGCHSGRLHLGSHLANRTALGAMLDSMGMSRAAMSRTAMSHSAGRRSDQQQCSKGEDHRCQGPEGHAALYLKVRILESAHPVPGQMGLMRPIAEPTTRLVARIGRHFVSRRCRAPIQSLFSTTSSTRSAAKRAWLVRIGRPSAATSTLSTTSSGRPGLRRSFAAWTVSAIAADSRVSLRR